MPDTAEEIVNNSLSQLVEGSYDGLLAAGVIGDSLYGQFITNGQVHDFQLSDRVFQHQEYRPDSIALNEFAFGYLETIGIRCDSEIESAYEYLKGIVGENVRRDRKPMVCKSGGVPCGGRCLPEGQKCRKGVGGAIASATKRAIGAVKTKGTVGNKLAKAALIGAGVVVGGRAALHHGAKAVGTEIAARAIHESSGGANSLQEARDISKKHLNSGLAQYKEAKQHDKLAAKVNKRIAQGKQPSEKELKKIGDIQQRIIARDREIHANLSRIKTKA